MMEKEKRLALWQKLLSRPEGVTYDGIEYAIDRDSSYNLRETLRKDVGYIKELLKESSAEWVESKEKKRSVFRISGEVDLLDLHYGRILGKPSRDIVKFITSCKGLLPDNVLSELSETYSKIMENKSSSAQIISFDSNYDSMAEMPNFLDVYKAINKKALHVVRHKWGDEEEKEELILYPEYLKQYNFQWFVFGIVSTLEGECSDTCCRIPLNLIEKVKPLSTREYPFRKSDTDYIEYFDEIVGVEYDPNCEFEKVQFYISYAMYKRIKANPIHWSQKEDKSLERKPGFKGMRIEVRRNKELIRTLLSYGKDLIVVSPIKLRNQMKREMNKALKNY